MGFRQDRFDGGPFIVAKFVAHDSRLRFGRLNHLQGGNINPQTPITAAANASAFGGIAVLFLI
jgi:hypothetical protein